jgi:hypothetical protein
MNLYNVSGESLKCYFSFPDPDESGMVAIKCTEPSLVKFYSIWKLRWDDIDSYLKIQEETGENLMDFVCKKFVFLGKKF